MRTLIASVGFAVCVAILPATVVLAPRPAAAREAKPKVDRKKVTDHLRQHQQYPATKAQLVESCNNLADFSPEEKQWFATNLPDRTYATADEVIKTLFQHR